jgi:hypothetical protein
MITQILGVALISLLTITPTIQQNNIEQLIAPNIEIQTNQFNVSNSNRMFVQNQFSYYRYFTSSFSTTYLNTNFNSIIDGFGSDVTFQNTIIGGNDTAARLLYITDNDFYMFASSPAEEKNGNTMKLIIEEYYKRIKGSVINSSAFSFSVLNQNLSTATTFYTYEIQGSGGPMIGRFYFTSSFTINQMFGPTINNNITLPQGSNMSDLITALNPQQTWAYSDNRYEQKILYYWLNSDLPTTIGTHSRSLLGRDNYGVTRNYGTFTINMVEPDTIPPTITGIIGNPINWTNQPVTITVNATDNIGLNSTAFSFDGGQNWQQSNQLITNFNQILEIRVRDTGGNIASQQITINRIDTSSPAINLAGNWKNTFELGELANNQALLNYLTISDNLSGLNNGLTTISNFNYNQAGSYSNIQVSATDNAGNNFVYTLPTVTITQPADNTGPIITGPTIVNRTEGNITTQGILDLYSITDISGIEPNTISIRDLNNNVITNWSSYIVGSYQLRVYARDTLNNVTQYQFTIQVGEALPPDLTPPTIVGPLLVSFEIGTYTSNTEILNLYTFTDNVGILQNQLIGEIDYSELGDYPVTIRSTDTSNNVTNRNIVVRIRDEVVLGNYNPLTDLLSGIFGGALSMIFTIGTINVLGLRLLDAMGVIILGAVLLFVYKAIKGGS